MLLLYNISINAQTSDESTQMIQELQGRFIELQDLSNKTLKQFKKIKEGLNATSKKHSFSLLGGYTENGFSILGSYNFYNGNTLKNLNNFIELSLLASFAEEKKSDYNLPVEIYSLNAGYFKRITMLSGTNKEFTTAIGLGGVFGYESINKNRTELQNGALILDKSKMIYGGFAGLNIDIYISDQIDLTTKTNFYYHANSDIAKTKFFIGLGIKYSILKNNKQ
jgi:hypothetical protein